MCDKRHSYSVADFKQNKLILETRQRLPSCAYSYQYIYIKSMHENVPLLYHFIPHTLSIHGVCSVKFRAKLASCKCACTRHMSEHRTVCTIVARTLSLIMTYQYKLKCSFFSIFYVRTIISKRIFLF